MTEEEIQRKFPGYWLHECPPAEPVLPAPPVEPEPIEPESSNDAWDWMLSWFFAIH